MQNRRYYQSTHLKQSTGSSVKKNYPASPLAETAEPSAAEPPGTTTDSVTTDIDAGAGMATTDTLAVKERHLVLERVSASLPMRFRRPSVSVLLLDLFLPERLFRLALLLSAALSGRRDFARAAFLLRTCCSRGICMLLRLSCAGGDFTG